LKRQHKPKNECAYSRKAVSTKETTRRKSMSNKEREFKAERKNRIRQRAEINRRTQYYMQQKLFGVVFILFAVALVLISHKNDISEFMILGVISFAVGLFVVMTKHMIFVNSYWLEKLENDDLI